jgi:hypothetical protein
MTKPVCIVWMNESSVSALFFLTKPLMQCALDQRESGWTRRISEPLAGKTLGILGLGAIGRELARKADALELKVIGTKRSPAPIAHVAKVCAPEATDEVLGASVFVLDDRRHRGAAAHRRAASGARRGRRRSVRRQCPTLSGRRAAPDRGRPGARVLKVR